MIDLIKCKVCGGEYQIKKRIVVCQCGENELASGARDLVGKLLGARNKLIRLDEGIITSHYSEREIQILNENRHLPACEVAKMLNRTSRSVWTKYSNMGNLKIKHWQPQEELFLKLHRHQTWIWNANQLGRSANSIRVRAQRMGIPKNRMMSDAQAKRVGEIASLNKYTLARIGKMFGVTDEAIRNTIRNRLKLDIPQAPIDEEKRSATRKKNLEDKYGVSTVAQVVALNKLKEFINHFGPTKASSFALAVVLKAVERIGSGARRSVQSECKKIKSETGWKKVPVSRGVSALLTELEKLNLINVERMPHKLGRGKAIYSAKEKKVVTEA